MNHVPKLPIVAINHKVGLNDWLSNLLSYNFHSLGASVPEISHSLSAPKNQNAILFILFFFFYWKGPMETNNFYSCHFLKLHHATLKHTANWHFRWHCSRMDFGEELSLPFGAKDHWLDQLCRACSVEIVWKLFRSDTILLIHHMLFIFSWPSRQATLQGTWNVWCLCNRAKCMWEMLPVSNNGKFFRSHTWKSLP